MSESQTKVDPLDMLNKFCFHLYAQKSLFSRKLQWVFFDIIILTTRSVDIRVHRAGSQLKTGKLCKNKYSGNAQFDTLYSKPPLYKFDIH